MLLPSDEAKEESSSMLRKRIAVMIEGEMYCVIVVASEDRAKGAVRGDRFSGATLPVIVDLRFAMAV